MLEFALAPQRQLMQALDDLRAIGNAARRLPVIEEQARDIQADLRAELDEALTLVAQMAKRLDEVAETAARMEGELHALHDRIERVPGI
ncbi:MAG: hypothetical protein H0U42_02105 [Thermoleophilaceae bacterium]|nr:hypothetical protein [Thermoleophilaceae bacterium]